METVLIRDFLGPRLVGWRHYLDLTFAVEPITVGLLPWTPVLPVAVRDGWWRADLDDGRRRKFRLLVFWALAYVVVMTLLPHHRVRASAADLSGARRHGGLAVGPVGGERAAGVASTVRMGVGRPGGRPGRRDRAAAPAAARVCRARPSDARAEARVVGLLLAGALLAIAAARAGRVLAMFAAVVVPVALMLAVETQVAVAGHNRVFDIRRLSERLAARAGAQDELVAYRYHPLPIQFYSGRAITRVQDPADLVTRAEAGRRFYVVAEDFAWADLVATRQAWTVVDSADVNGIRVLVGTPVARP